jgi:hypothetical protein
MVEHEFGSWFLLALITVTVLIFFVSASISFRFWRIVFSKRSECNDFLPAFGVNATAEVINKFDLALNAESTLKEPLVKEKREFVNDMNKELIELNRELMIKLDDVKEKQELLDSINKDLIKFDSKILQPKSKHKSKALPKPTIAPPRKPDKAPAKTLVSDVDELLSIILAPLRSVIQARGCTVKMPTNTGLEQVEYTLNEAENIRLMIRGLLNTKVSDNPFLRFDVQKNNGKLAFFVSIAADGTRVPREFERSIGSIAIHDNSLAVQRRVSKFTLKESGKEIYCFRCEVRLSLPRQANQGQVQPSI